MYFLIVLIYIVEILLLYFNKIKFVKNIIQNIWRGFIIIFIKETELKMDKKRVLVNGLKGSKIIRIDRDIEDVSQFESDISDNNPVQLIKVNAKKTVKFCPITPIRKIISKKTKPVILVQREKNQQAQVISDDQSQNIINYPQAQENKRQVKQNPEHQKVFKKRLVKVSNKCKIQRKQYSNTQCSICLGSIQFKDQYQIGRLDCKHIFCYECILQSSKFSSRCPYCRAAFQCIVRNGQLIPVEYKQPSQDDFDPYEEPCYICGRNDDFDHLLECQYCQAAFCHTYCDNRLESDVPPQQSWYCLSCSSLLGH